MNRLSKYIGDFKKLLEKGRYGGELIYQIDISSNPNRKGCIYILKTNKGIYYGVIRLHLNEASILYNISIDELEKLSKDIAIGVEVSRSSGETAMTGED